MCADHGTTLEHLRKKRIAFLPSKRRKNNDLVFSNLLFEGRCSIQLSYGRVVEAILILKHLPPLQKSNPPFSAVTVSELCQNSP